MTFYFLFVNVKKEGVCVYFLFRNSCIPSIVVVYWNPASTSLCGKIGLVCWP